MRTALIKTTANALFQLRAKMATALLDLRFGRLLRGAQETRFAQMGAYAISNSSYAAVRHLFRGRVKDSDVLVDVGCGKGRVINSWLADGYTNRVIGVELDAEVAASTRARLRHFHNVSIVCGDIVANFPDDGTLFYLFNPFDAPAMMRFKDRLKESVARRSMGEATVIYYNCRHAEVFAKDESCGVEYGMLEHPFAVIRVLARSGQRIST
jgi:SAM-dependent methyltransferase